MANKAAIKSRIHSVKSTRQITKAMELVSAAKMRRAQDAALVSRIYSNKAESLLSRLDQLTDIETHELYVKRDVKARLLVLITSDSGLAGAYNANAIKLFLNQVQNDKQAGIKTYAICIGNKGAQLATRLSEVQILGTYRNHPDDIDPRNLMPVVNVMVERFTTGDIDAADIIFTHFQSSINQVAKSRRLLPAGFSDEPVSSELRLAEFEPSISQVLSALTVRLLEAQVMQSLLESTASEHSMRMVAMKNATDNASDIVDDLTLLYNNARQAAITQELAEITGGAEALK